MRYVSQEEIDSRMAIMKVKRDARKRMVKKLFKFSTDVRNVKEYIKNIRKICASMMNGKYGDEVYSFAVQLECESLKMEDFLSGKLEHMPETQRKLVEFMEKI